MKGVDCSCASGMRVVTDERCPGPMIAIKCCKKPVKPVKPVKHQFTVDSRQV